MKTFGIIGVVATASVAAGIGFVAGVIVTTKAAFSGALAIAALDMKVKKDDATQTKTA